jgi:glycosyltransferase involved in cell wall biosynthesis
MLVGVDARCLNGKHLRGMGKYLWEVIARADRRHEVAWELFGDQPELPLRCPPVRRARVHLFTCRGFRFRSWEQLALPNRCRRLRVDVLHSTATTLPWWQPVPTVVTIHDALPWLQDEPGWPRGWYLDRVLPAAFRKCAAVITISESSRNDILRQWPQLAEKLHVIPHGIADRYLSEAIPPPGEALQAAGVRPPYLLYLGGLVPRKRLPWAIRILEEVEDRRVRLVVCGVESSAHNQVYATLRAELRERVCFAPFIDEADMPSVYRHALAVLYPTLYEGFGFPVLEAQAVGTPVLHSTVSSLAELQGPGSVALPADDLDAWTAACRRLVASRRGAPRPDEKARQWARRFSWDVCADRHMSVYLRAVAGQGRRSLAPGRAAASPSHGELVRSLR